MKKFGALLVFVVMGSASIIALPQSVPQLINYQGRIANSAGQPLSDGTTVDLTFKFYGVESGQTPLYLTALQEDVAVNAGIFNVLIGSGTIAPGAETSLAAVFQKHGEVWMGVKVDSDPEMTPRARISSGAYAFWADYAAAMDTNYLRDLDLDGDGHFKPASASLPNDDCDDWNNEVHAGAVEICGDGIDQNCRNGDCYLVDDYPYINISQDLTLRGKYGYGIRWGDLVIFDASNPYYPSYVVKDYYIPFCGAPPTKLWVDEYPYFAYAVCPPDLMINRPSLHKIDIGTDPSSPEPSSMLYGASGHDWRDVRVSDNVAYLAAGADGLEIWDLNSSAMLSSLPGFEVYRVELHYNGSGYFDDRLYLLADGALKIVNVSNRLNPQVVGTFAPPEEYFGSLFSKGNMVYLLAGLENTLYIVDAADPASPTLRGTYQISDPVYGDPFVTGNYAYLPGNRLWILNVSNPASPRLEGYLPLPHATNQVYAKDGYIYLITDIPNFFLATLFSHEPP